MTPLDKLIKTIKQYHPNADTDMVKLAYEYAEEAHKGQMRLCGEQYFQHPLDTAQKLAEWHMPPNIVTAGLLHDVVEDSPRTTTDITVNFGEEIASLVDRVTKLSKIQYHGMERYIENLRKMFMAIAEDVRVIFIKFADRIDNLEDLGVVPNPKQKRIALESLEIYAQIANRLGMGSIRRELEDLSFKYVYPKEYEWVTELVKDRLAVQSDCLENTQKIAKKDLEKAGIKIISISGRVKGFYSLYKKLLIHDRDISQIYDIYASRIIVPTLADCYAAMGVMHSRWKPLKGRIKDYIAFPKPNGYQSLHTTVFCESGNILEFQIRTPQMHEEAEFGIAAHWFYKEKGKKTPSPTQTAWMKELIEIQKNIQDSSKFLQTLDSLKIDIFKNRIFVFTPNGDVIDLPEDATPVDFAYAVHSWLGDHCTGAKVNDEMSPLDKKLLSGDRVEIILDKNRKGPSSDWLKSVKTRNAREKIKSQIKKNRLGDWFKNIVPMNAKKKD